MADLASQTRDPPSQARTLLLLPLLLLQFLQRHFQSHPIHLRLLRLLLLLLLLLLLRRRRRLLLPMKTATRMSNTMIF